MPEAHVEVIKSERGSEGRRAGGSGGRRAARAAPAASDAPGNPGHPARRKLFAITDFLPAPGPRTGGTHVPPPVGLVVGPGSVCPNGRGKEAKMLPGLAGGGS